MSTKLYALAEEVAEKVKEMCEDDGTLDVEDTIEDVLSETISERFTSDNDIIAIIGEIDLDATPDGDSLFRAIQKEAENTVRGFVGQIIDPALYDRNQRGPGR
jgi:hypothetical protein